MAKISLWLVVVLVVAATGAAVPATELALAADVTGLTPTGAGDRLKCEAGM